MGFAGVAARLLGGRAAAAAPGSGMRSSRPERPSGRGQDCGPPAGTCVSTSCCGASPGHPSGARVPYSRRSSHRSFPFHDRGRPEGAAAPRTGIPEPPAPARTAADKTGRGSVARGTRACRVRERGGRGCGRPTGPDRLTDGDPAGGPVAGCAGGEVRVRPCRAEDPAGPGQVGSGAAAAGLCAGVRRDNSRPLPFDTGVWRLRAPGFRAAHGRGLTGPRAARGGRAMVDRLL